MLTSGLSGIAHSHDLPNHPCHFGPCPRPEKHRDETAYTPPPKLATEQRECKRHAPRECQCVVQSPDVPPESSMHDRVGGNSRHLGKTVSENAELGNED